MMTHGRGGLTWHDLEPSAHRWEGRVAGRSPDTEQQSYAIFTGSAGDACRLRPWSRGAVSRQPCMIFELGKEQTMTRTNATTCGVSVAALMAASVLISVPATSALAVTPCPANSSNVVTPTGYSITAVACGLNFPTAMTLQGDTIWVTEEGTATSPPKVKQIDKMGTSRPCSTRV
jgi:hypothetical protein